MPLAHPHLHNLPVDPIEELVALEGDVVAHQRVARVSVLYVHRQTKHGTQSLDLRGGVWLCIITHTHTHTHNIHTHTHTHTHIQHNTHTHTHTHTHCPLTYSLTHSLAHSPAQLL